MKRSKNENQTQRTYKTGTKPESNTEIKIELSMGVELENGKLIIRKRGEKNFEQRFHP